MKNKKMLNAVGLMLMMAFMACNVPYVGRTTESRAVPMRYTHPADTVNIARMKWKDYFKDADLNALIDSALQKNQELNILLQEINISRNEVRARKGAYLPTVGIGAAAGVEKAGRYTSQGASDAHNDITPGNKVPEVMPDYFIGLTASWEADIWKKLRNARKSALYTYLSSIEGKNFMVTNLIAEISNAYYELMALDNQLEILKRNIEIQQNALEIVKLEKISARATELAVRRFEAEVLKNQSNQYYIMQQITETENRVNFLVGRFPQPVRRNSGAFADMVPDSNIHTGIPANLLENRPDIRRAEHLLAVAKMDVRVARAEFYPSLMIFAGAGYQGFNPKYLIQTPESLIFSLAGELVTPLINRNAIKAKYYSANSKQIQAVYNYERSILDAYIEVANQLSNMDNLKKSYDLKAREVQALTQSIDISIVLFRSARADYMEVLLTQRDALESKFELIETRKQQMNAMVNIYRALGGGWN